MTEAPRFRYFHNLIEHQAKTIGDRPYILYEDHSITFTDFDKAACRAASGLVLQGAGPGDGVAVLMGNCPEYLYLFYGMPRAGIYSVPVNVSLKGDGLRFILSHSQARFLIIDDTLFPNYSNLESPVGAIEKIFVRRTSDQPLPEGTQDLSILFDASPQRPDHEIDPEAISYLMYTSGTTGLPKGVVNRVGAANMNGLMMLAGLLITGMLSGIYPAVRAGLEGEPLRLETQRVRIPAIHAGHVAVDDDGIGSTEALGQGDESAFGQRDRIAGGHQAGGAVAVDCDDAPFHDDAGYSDVLLMAKLSPQPQWLSALGFLNFRLAFSPSVT